MPKVSLKRRPDAATGLFHGGTAQWACLLAYSGAADDKWTNTRSASWSGQFSSLYNVTLE